MATQTARVVVVSLVLLATAWPVHARMTTAPTDNQSVLVHFLFRRHAPLMTSAGARYKMSARTVGLWHSPGPEELGHIYLKRRDYRQPRQTMPLLLVEW